MFYFNQIIMDQVQIKYNRNTTFTQESERVDLGNISSWNKSLPNGILEFKKAIS